jgi:hypothetical protein
VRTCPVCHHEEWRRNKDSRRVGGAFILRLLNSGSRSREHACSVVGNASDARCVDLES